jgi:hypothetical protein
VWFNKDGRPLVDKTWQTTKVYGIWAVDQTKIAIRVIVEIAIDVTDFAMGKIACVVCSLLSAANSFLLCMCLSWENDLFRFCYAFLVRPA